MICVLLDDFMMTQQPTGKINKISTPSEDTRETFSQKLASQNTRIIHPWITGELMPLLPY